MFSLSTSNVSPWLSYEAAQHRVETHSLVTKQPLPINRLVFIFIFFIIVFMIVSIFSVDVVGGSVVFGGDTEAFYVLHNVIA